MRAGIMSKRTLPLDTTAALIKAVCVHAANIGVDKTLSSQFQRMARLLLARGAHLEALIAAEAAAATADIDCKQSMRRAVKTVREVARQVVTDGGLSQPALAKRVFSALHCAENIIIPRRALDKALTADWQEYIGIVMRQKHSAIAIQQTANVCNGCNETALQRMARRQLARWETQGIQI